MFVVKLRDEKADELCFFQLTNGTTVEAGIEFFENLIRRVNFILYFFNNKVFQLILSSNRDISLDELSIEQLQSQCTSRPEEYEAITKALYVIKKLKDLSYKIK